MFTIEQFQQLLALLKGENPKNVNGRWPWDSLPNLTIATALRRNENVTISTMAEYLFFLPTRDNYGVGFDPELIRWFAKKIAYRAGGSTKYAPGSVGYWLASDKTKIQEDPVSIVQAAAPIGNGTLTRMIEAGREAGEMLRQQEVLILMRPVEAILIKINSDLINR